jgi:hypothetical protein
MNNTDEELLFDLFAHRIQFMDYSNDELYIIKRLKQKLIELGYAEENLNTIIYSFYNYFNILITMDEIESVNINQQVQVGPYFLQHIFSSLITQPPILEENDEHDDDDMPPLEEAPQEQNNELNIGNLLNIIIGQPTLGNNIFFNQIVIQPINNNHSFMQDVVVTTDQNTLNTLNILKITKEINEKCMICIEEMNECEEYFDIQCKHIFHKGCLETYLKNYNHICPVCRNEIGESNPQLN